MKEFLTKVADYLVGQGFLATPVEDHLDIVLSEEDSKVVIDNYVKSGLPAADSMIRKAGIQFQSILIASGLTPNYSFEILGYDVDDKKETIAIRMKPTKVGDIKRIKKESTVDQRVKRFYSLFPKYKQALLEADADTTVEHMQKVLSKTLSKNENERIASLVQSIRKLVDEAELPQDDKTLMNDLSQKEFDHVEKVMDVGDAIQVMESFLDEGKKKENKETKKDKEDKKGALQSLKDKIEKAGAKIDVVTDVVVGKDDGPLPEKAEEKTPKLKEKKPELAEEDIGKPKEKALEQAIKGTRHVEAMELVERAVELNIIPESKRREEFKAFLAMDQAKFDEFKKVLSSIENGDNDVLMVEGNLANLQDLLDE